MYSVIQASIKPDAGPLSGGHIIVGAIEET
jgi:hypothetical protein